MAPRRAALGFLVLTITAACGTLPGPGRDGGGDGGSGSWGAWCNSELDCGLDFRCEQHVCVSGPPPVVTSTAICTRDSDCDPGLECVRSTGKCLAPTVRAGDAGAGDEDAGPPLDCAPGLEESCGGSKLGECRQGIRRCEPNDSGGYSFSACLGAILPQAETCDGKDNDCNGIIDDGLPHTPEICDGIDNDCNGLIDDGIAPVRCGLGVCARTVSCSGGQMPACVPGTPTPEVCNGLDDDCDGVVDDTTCGPGGTCPANQNVNPNTTVTLTTSASSPSGRPVSCAWTVLSRPATSNGTFSSPTSCTSSNYFADVVGTHVLHFTVTDSTGLTTSCDTTITVQAIGGLWVELSWSVNDDLDLHLLPSAASSTHAAASWMNTTDAYFANRTPSWDAAGTADDPSLDRDDITGMGPENTRINVPSTAHPYTIGVHMYSYAASPAPVNSTIRIYCNGVLRTTQTHTFTTNRQLWVVGQVQFSASGCVYTNDNTALQLP